MNVPSAGCQHAPTTIHHALLWLRGWRAETTEESSVENTSIDLSDKIIRRLALRCKPPLLVASLMQGGHILYRRSFLDFCSTTPYASVCLRNEREASKEAGVTNSAIRMKAEARNIFSMRL